MFNIKNISILTRVAILPLVSILISSCQEVSHCPISEIKVYKGKYASHQNNTREFNGNLKISIAATLKRVSSIGVESGLNHGLHQVSKEIISGEIKLDSAYVQKYNGYASTICSNYSFLSSNNLSNNSKAKIDSMIILQLHEFYDFVKNYDASEEKEDESNTSTSPEVKTSPVTSDEIQDKFKPRKIENLIIINTAINESNQPVEGVKIWCQDCLDKDIVLTNAEGEFHLSDRYFSSENPTFRLNICFKKLNFSKCIHVNPNYLSSFISPIIKL